MIADRLSVRIPHTESLSSADEEERRGDVGYGIAVRNGLSFLVAEKMREIIELPRAGKILGNADAKLAGTRVNGEHVFERI